MKSHDKIIMPKSRLKIFIPVADFITFLRSSLSPGAREELATQLKLHNDSRYFLKFLFGLRGVCTTIIT